MLEVWHVEACISNVCAAPVLYYYSLFPYLYLQGLQCFGQSVELGIHVQLIINYLPLVKGEERSLHIFLLQPSFKILEEICNLLGIMWSIFINANMDHG